MHRLDKTTSGLLVLARTRKAAQDLARRFHEGSTGHGGEEAEARIQKKVSRGVPPLGVLITKRQKTLCVPFLSAVHRHSSFQATVEDARG